MNSKELLEKYVTAVMNAPHSLSLTAVRDPKEFWQRHVLDALKLIELLPPDDHEKTMKVMDVGSGNGIPGVPIAIALPSWSLLLLDSNSKKCGFIDMFCKFNEIKNVRTIAGRAEAIGRGEHREAYDLVFARAVGKLPVALEIASPFVKVGGLLVVPHGTSWDKELENSKKAMKELGLILKDNPTYQLGSDINYTALIFEKMSETPEIYPRAIGIPSKRPL